MAYTPLKIHIPDPCHEDWQGMTPVPGTSARHCDACEKNVVDFTGFSDARLNAYVRENKGKLCGRFRPDQVGRPLPARKKPSYQALKVAAAAAGLMLSSCTKQPPSMVVGEMVMIEEQPSATLPEVVIYGETDVPVADPGVIITGEVAPEFFNEPDLGEQLIEPLVTDTVPAAKDNSDTADYQPEGMIMGLIMTPELPQPTGFDLIKDTLVHWREGIPGSGTPPATCPKNPAPASAPNSTARALHLDDISNFAVVPNPFVTEARIELMAKSAQRIQVNILDVDGRELEQLSWTVGQGKNVRSFPAPTTAAKVIYLRLTDQHGRSTTRPAFRK